MTPERGTLLLLTLSLGLASAQQTLEEVPVQPDFDARKVTVPVREPGGPWTGTWVLVSWNLAPGGGRRAGRKGQGWARTPGT